MNESNIVLLILIAAGLMILLVISLVLFFNFSQKKILSEKERNHKQKMDFQKEMLASTIKTQEEERSRIARELHDDLSSKLNVVNMNMEFLMLKLQNDEHKESLEEVSQVIKTAIDRSRKMSHELMPPIIEKFGLQEAIKDLASQINSTGKLTMKIFNQQNLENTKGKIKLHIFRIVQELCNNTLKHAEANAISLDCSSKEGILELNYRDDGKGIAEANMKKGIGMMNIESRIQILNGEWEQIPSDKGVWFKLKIPYAAQISLSG